MELKVAKDIKVNQNEYTKETEQPNAYNGELEKVFSERLTSLMEGSTQETVAKDTGISRQNLSKYMLGKALPNTKNLFILAKYFDASCDYLLGFTDSPHNDFSYFRMIINFSATCKKNLEQISNDGSISKTFDDIICNESFVQLLKYIRMYLLSSAKPKKFSTDEIIESYEKITKITTAVNSHFFYKSLPKDGIKISDVYLCLIQKELQEMISKISKKDARESTEIITRIAEMELGDSI